MTFFISRSKKKQNPKQREDTFLTLFWNSKLNTMRQTDVEGGLGGFCEVAGPPQVQMEAVKGSQVLVWGRPCCPPSTSTSLMAFYGTLESLWLLLTQWDLLLMGGGGARGGCLWVEAEQRLRCQAEQTSFGVCLKSVGQMIRDFGSVFVIIRTFSRGVGRCSGLCKMESRNSA